MGKVSRTFNSGINMGGLSAFNHNNGHPAPKRLAHDYAQRIRARPPGRVQTLREAAGLTKYGLAQKSGVSRDIEAGESIPTMYILARLAQGVSVTLKQLVRGMEDG